MNGSDIFYCSGHGHMTSIILTAVSLLSSRGSQSEVSRRCRRMDDISRARFSNHMYVFSEGVIFDACVGPALGTQTNVEYLKALIDTSTETEMNRSFFSPYEEFDFPKKIIFETRNYKVQ